MEKKVVVITGCSSGIGLETAIYLQKRGLDVVATARKASDVTKIEQLGLDSYKLDVRSSQDIKEAIKFTVKKY